MQKKLSNPFYDISKFMLNQDRVPENKIIKKSPRMT